MEQTFKFTVELTHEVYAKLRAESNNREGSKGAVPSRTARQLIEERLEELAADNPTPPMPRRLPEEHGISEGDLIDKPNQAIKESGRGKPGPEPPIPSGLPSEQKSKKHKSRKIDVDADESAPTI